MSLVSPFRLVTLTIVTALFLPMLVQGPASADPPEGGDYGGNVRVAVLAPVSLNPSSAGQSNRIVHQLVYDSLARESPGTFLPEPWLATGWTIDEVAKTITFTLSSDARWSDGTPLTADDVVYSYQKAGYTATNQSAAVVVDLRNDPGGRFMDQGIYLPIAYKDGSSTFSFSGPFWANETAADHMTFAANMDYWKGRPYLDSIRYDYYANFSLAACAFVERRATFLGILLSGSDVNTVNYPCNRQLVNTTNLLPQLYFSMNPGLSVVYLGMNTAKPPLNYASLRLAITKALDRDGFTGGSLGSTPIKPYSDVADSFISPLNTYWFNTSIPEYRVPRAVVSNRVEKIFDDINLELDAAGFMDWNNDGWRESPSRDLFNLTFLHIKTETPAFVTTIADDLRRIGLNIVDRPVDTYADVNAAVAQDNFDLALNGLEAAHEPSFLYDHFHSSQIAGAGKNYFNYDDPTMDMLLEGMENSPTIATRQKYVKDAQNWIATHVPAAPILHFRALYVYDKLDYEGWVDQLGGIDNFWSFYNLRSIPRGSMRVQVSALVQGNRLNSGESTDIQVAVENETGPIVGANVEIQVTNGSVSNPVGVTDDTYGRYIATYTAAIVGSVTDVFITASVTKPGHSPALGQTAVAVHPGLRTMSVGVKLSPNTRNLASNEEISIELAVADSMDSSIMIPGAEVTISIVPDRAGGWLSLASGTTDSSGIFETKFKADVPVDTNFALQVRVKHSGYSDYTTSTGLIVTRRGGTPATPGPDATLLVAVVALLAFAYGVRRRKRGEN